MPTKVIYLVKVLKVLKLNLHIVQVAYERVNLADIETSSDEDDYGDLFAHVSWKNMFVSKTFILWGLKLLRPLCTSELGKYTC